MEPYSNAHDKRGKVYINPNFNKKQKPATYHVNPAFSAQNLASMLPQTSKIHVNPNFVQRMNYNNLTAHQTYSNLPYSCAPSTSNNMPAMYTNSISTTTSMTQTAPIPISKPSYSYVRQKPVEKEGPVIPTVLPQTTPVSKTKYSLVRHRKKCTKTTPQVNKENQGITISLSKYKSVKLKPNLEVPTSNTKTLNSSVTKRPNKYTFVRSKSTDLTTPKKLVRNSITLPRLLKTRAVSTPKGKYVKPPVGKLKKNNIPCPQFRKFGRCLRMEKSVCNYLHDKKHVSICRKFLKGLCFNADCLFSHDLTSKKMPTCHFFLEGACTKDDCPYVHVKLNDSVDLCSDFQKGYCEKGENCTKRHVSTQQKITTKRSSNNVKRKIRSTPKPEARISKFESTPKEKVVTAGNETADNRYYDERTNDKGEEVCNIKPTRCKLGTLPSFISL